MLHNPDNRATVIGQENCQGKVAHTTFSPTREVTMDMKQAAIEDYESQVTLLDRSGQPLASVRASFLPSLRFGGFRLPSSADVSHVLASVTTAQMPGSHSFRL